MGPSDTAIRPLRWLWLPTPGCPLLAVRALDRVSQVPDGSFRARYLLSPRGVRAVHWVDTFPHGAGFIISGSPAGHIGCIRSPAPYPIPRIPPCLGASVVGTWDFGATTRPPDVSVATVPVIRCVPICIPALDVQPCSPSIRPPSMNSAESGAWALHGRRRSSPRSCWRRGSPGKLGGGPENRCARVWAQHVRDFRGLLPAEMSLPTKEFGDGQLLPPGDGPNLPGLLIGDFKRQRGHGYCGITKLPPP